MRYLLLVLCIGLLAGSCASQRQPKLYKKKWSLFKKNDCDCPNLR
jgi:hypothetical protein